MVRPQQRPHTHQTAGQKARREASSHRARIASAPRRQPRAHTQRTAPRHARRPGPRLGGSGDRRGQRQQVINHDMEARSACSAAGRKDLLHNTMYVVCYLGQVPHLLGRSARSWRSTPRCRSNRWRSAQRGVLSPASNILGLGKASLGSRQIPTTSSCEIPPSDGGDAGRRDRRGCDRPRITAWTRWTAQTPTLGVRAQREGPQLPSAIRFRRLTDLPFVTPRRFALARARHHRSRRQFRQIGCRNGMLRPHSAEYPHGWCFGAAANGRCAASHYITSELFPGQLSREARVTRRVRRVARSGSIWLARR